MQDFVIVADTTCGMSAAAAQELGIVLIDHVLNIGGQDYPSSMPTDELYKLIEQHPNQCITGSASPQIFYDAFSKIAAQKQDIVYFYTPLGISAGIANSANCALIQIQEQFPECHIVMIDSCTMSWGYGLLLEELSRQHCRTLDEAIDFVIQQRDFIQHYFTMSDLSHAAASGKISKLELFLASKLNMQPALELVYDDDGIKRLMTVGKVKGAVVQNGIYNPCKDKWARQVIADTAKHLANSAGTVYVTYGGHGIALERASYIAEQLRKQLPQANIVCDDEHRVTPLIGCHVGPTVVSVHFIGDEKVE